MSLISPNDRTLASAIAPLGARYIECAMSDFSSIARGKMVSAADFVSAQGCKLPTVLLGMGVTGGSPSDLFGSLLPKAYGDMRLVPDLETLVPRPGRSGEFSVLCEPEGHWYSERYQRQVDAHELSPRAFLRRTLRAYEQQGLQALVAPELELFLLDRKEVGDQQIISAARQPGQQSRESACEQYSLERSTQFEPFFDELYKACEVQGIQIAGHLHEAALSQFEVNFHPGDPLSQADAVFRFKRLAREIAARQGFLASFAPKIFSDQPGVGMHWHFSLQRSATGGNIWPHLFADQEGQSTPALGHFIAGLQSHLPESLALFMPYDMSFDRMLMNDSSPTHADWAEDDRHVAFRIPASDAAARRVENRLPGGDVNPYLAVGWTLAFGLQGLQLGHAPRSGRDETTRLPRSLSDALSRLNTSDAVRNTLGSPLVDLFVALKSQESSERNSKAQPVQQWDLRHLLELA